MLTLPDVTLIMIETMEHDLARLAIQECLDKVKFGDVLICTDRPEQFSGLACKPRFVEVPNWPSKLGWSKFHWQVGPHVHTAHTIGIQWDSWVWDVSKWSDEFYEYDIIGAPWEWHPNRRVGNLGFGWRSKQILQFMYDHRDQFPIVHDADDALVCRTYRNMLEDCGLTFAPERVAWDFAFECSKPSPESRHFGFHAAQNFKYVLDHDRLLERARMMQQSKYIIGSYIWRNFCELNPDVVAELETEISVAA